MLLKPGAVIYLRMVNFATTIHSELFCYVKLLNEVTSDKILSPIRTRTTCRWSNSIQR